MVALPGDERSEGMMLDAGEWQPSGFNDDSGRFQASTSITVPPGPPEYVRQLQRFTNTLLGASTMALFRVFLRPTTAAEPPGGAQALPGWFQAEWRRRSLLGGLSKQWFRDTAAFTACTYVMEGGEALAKAVRGGTDDALNKAIGGAAAGAGIGAFWYGRHASGPIAILAICGSIAGYTTYSTDRSLSKLILERQQELEKELLHKTDRELRPEPDAYYLRELLLLKQKQVVEQKQHEVATNLPGGAGNAPAARRPAQPRSERGFAASAPSVDGDISNADTPDEGYISSLQTSSGYHGAGGRYDADVQLGSSAQNMSGLDERDVHWDRNAWTSGSSSQLSDAIQGGDKVRSSDTWSNEPVLVIEEVSDSEFR